MLRFIITGLFGGVHDADRTNADLEQRGQRILQRPLFGYGVKMLWASRGEYSTGTAMVHNNLLQFLTEGGLTGLALFLIMIAAAVKCLRIRRNRMEDILLWLPCAVCLRQ